MYGFHASLGCIEFDEAIRPTKQALQQEGIGVLSDVDLQKAMKEKLGAPGVLEVADEATVWLRRARDALAGSSS